MEVIIGNLPDNATQSDVLELLKPFQRYMSVKLQIKHFEDGTSVHFAVANFTSDRHALKAIKQYHQSVLRGVRLVVREYFHRSYSNEHRDLGWRNRQWSAQERRGHERRRVEVTHRGGSHLETGLQTLEQEEEKQKVRVEGYRNLAQKD